MLRPDLYPETAIALPAAPVDDVDAARARLYLLLGKLLRQAPDEAFLADLARLAGDGSEIGMAVIALADAARQTTAAEVSHEFFALFVGVGRGEILPYASFYLTGFLNERPLARVRADLARLGIARVDGDHEPEDHAGTLFETMAGLADGTFEASAEEQQRLFTRHLAPWIERFFLDLEAAGSARFYRSVARLGRAFVAIEAEGYAIAA